MGLGGTFRGPGLGEWALLDLRNTKFQALFARIALGEKFLRVAWVHAMHGNVLLVCEGGTRGARTAHGFVGEGPWAGSSPPPPMEARLALMAAIAAPWPARFETF